MQHSLYAHLPPPLMEEGSDDHHHQHQVYNLHPFLPTYETSPLPSAFFLSRPCQEGSSESTDHRHDRAPLQEEVKEHFFSTGSSDEHSSALRSSPATVEDGEGSRHKNDAREGGDPPDHSGSGKWMSSKMRFVRKMMGSDKMIAPMGRPRKSTVQEQQSRINGESNNSPPAAGTVRVCSDCNTTKTPLWRSGPRGPKSLCNACGIRQRKARRAMAAAAAMTGAGVIPAAAVAQLPKARKEQKRSAGGSDCCTVPFKKRFKFTAAAAAAHRNRKSKLHFDHEALAVGMSKNSAFQRVLGPQDEKEEAAILLMALSCGLIRG